MAKKLDLSRYHRPPALTETQAFTESLQDLVEVEFTLKAVPEYNTVLKVQQLAAKYIKEYIETADGSLPAPPPTVDGEPVELSKSLCVKIATVQIMESPPEGEAQYTFEELASMNVMFPNVFAGLCDWASSLMERASTGDKSKVPNDSAAA